MKKFVKKLTIALLACSFISLSAYADNNSSSSNSFTSSDEVKKAQVAMSTNEYIVTAGDIYTLAFASGSFSISIDSTYKVRIANLGFINAQGLTLQEFKNRVEALVISNYPSGGIQFFLTNPASFHVFIKGEVSKADTISTWALEHVSSLVSSYYTGYSSKRFVTVISADGTEKHYDLYKAIYDGDFAQDPYLRPGDTIVIPKLDRKVTIEGSVIRSGEYELLPGEELNSLIFDYAKGFSPFADKDNILIDCFTGASPLYQSVYIKETDLHSDRPLACYDKVYIPSKSNTQGVIYVEGAVNSYYNVSTKSVSSELPGSVTTSPSSIARLKVPFSTGKTCKKLFLEHSRMLLNSANLSEVYVWRKAKNSGEKDQKIFINMHSVLYPTGNDDVVEDVALEPEDTIVIPYTQYYVNVTGAVASPGKYPYQPGRDWNYYIGLASGLDYDQNLFNIVKITDKNGKRLNKKSAIPPEATIYASRNSPRNGWLVPLLITIMSFITSCLTFYTTIKGFQF